MNASHCSFRLPPSRSRILYGFLSALLVAAIAGRAEAQLGPGVREGSRIRVSTPSVKKATGTVRSISADSVEIFTEVNGATLTLATRDISDLRVSRGRSALHGAKRGAIWGGAIGATAALAVIPAALADDTYDADSGDAAAFALQSVLGGVVWGAAIGAFVKAEKWDTLRLQPRIGTSPRRIGIGFSLSPAALH